MAKEKDMDGDKVRCKNKAFLYVFFFCYAHWKKGARPYLAILTAIGIIYSVKEYEKDFLNLFRSKEQKKLDTQYEVGILSPFLVGGKGDIYHGSGHFSFEVPDHEINLGDFGFATSCFRKGVDGKISSDEGFNIWLTVRGNYFYVSLTVRDLITRAVLGELIENQWRSKQNAPILEAYHTEKAVEVVDQYKNVAFRIWVDSTDHVRINGYFVGTFCTQIMGEGPLQIVDRDDPKYEEKVFELAAQLKPMFIKLSPSH